MVPRAFLWDSYERFTYELTHIDTCFECGRYKWVEILILVDTRRKFITGAEATVKRTSIKKFPCIFNGSGMEE